MKIDCRATLEGQKSHARSECHGSCSMKLKISAAQAADQSSTNTTQMEVLGGETLVVFLHNECNAVTASLEMGDVMSRTSFARFDPAT